MALEEASERPTMYADGGGAWPPGLVLRWLSSWPKWPVGPWTCSNSSLRRQTSLRPGSSVSLADEHDRYSSTPPPIVI